MAEEIGPRPCTDKMTSQNILSKISLLSLLVIGSIVQTAYGGSRQNDSSEIPINTTREWHQSPVSPIDTRGEVEAYDRAVTLPSEDVYDSINPPEETPPLEEDMLNSERFRESGYEEKLPFQSPPDLDFSQRDAINVTLNNNPVEEGILFNENDRDDTLSDMLPTKTGNQEQRKELVIQKDEEPRFEYLIGIPVENYTLTTKRDEVENQTRKPFVPPKSAWPVPHAQFLTAEPKLNHTTGLPDPDLIKKTSTFDDKRQDAAEDYIELVEVVKNNSENVTKSVVTFNPHSNETGHYLENDAPDTSFNDLQTLFLACFATLVPLLIVLLLACALRIIWRRYRRDRRGTGYQGGLRGGSADPLPDKRPHSPSTELKSAESGFSGPHDDNDNGNRQDQPLVQPPANGSIITMTLKNNHLIVETEVRNDIAHGARETKMKYSPNNDGVFVVEVQQSDSQIRRSPEQRVQVHRSPLTIHSAGDELDGKVPPTKLLASNTGLSTSDLSISSAGSHNPSYAYGNQIGYEQGRYGYPMYSGYELPPKSNIPSNTSKEPLISKTPTDPDKPVVTAAIFKQDSIIAGDDIKTPEYNIEGSTDGPLLSDIQAREISLHKLQDKIEHGTKTRIIANSDSVPSSDTDEERYQEQQRQLGNGMVKRQQTIVEINHDKSNPSLLRADSLPPRLIEEERLARGPKLDDGFDVIEEESSIDCYPGDIASGSPLLGSTGSGTKSKRASLPNITPDLYTTLKQTTKNILPNLSPKFEKLNNENSPMETNGDKKYAGPPLITVTEEAEAVNSPDEVPS